MTSKTVLCAILAASFLTAPVAVAQGDSPGANRNRYEQNQRSNERDRGGDYRGDYILVVIATGVILQLLLNNGPETKEYP